MPLWNNSSVFRPIVPGQPVAVLLLIENGGLMAQTNRWLDLRDRVLPTLLGKLRIANQGVPIQVLVLPSLPAPEGQAPAKTDREFYELPDLTFNFHENNCISISRIHLGIDNLMGAFAGLPAARHLFIVAASTPYDDMETIRPSSIVHNHASGWQQLGHKLAQYCINCHLVLDPSHNVQGFTEMFQTSLTLQGGEEVVPRFGSDRHTYLVRISGTSIFSSGDLRPIAPRLQTVPQSDPILLPRSESYPCDLNILGDRYMSGDAQPNPSPPVGNLVTRLQQIHGMTKKKIYGTKPARQPFFKDEPVDEKHCHAPPLEIPVSTPSSPTSATSPTRDPRRTKARARSLSNKGLPSEAQSRARRQSRRSSRVSSPERTPVAVRRMSNSSSLSSAVTTSSHPGYDPTSTILPSPTSPIHPGYTDEPSSGSTDNYSHQMMLPNVDFDPLVGSWNNSLYGTEPNSPIKPGGPSGIPAHAPFQQTTTTNFTTEMNHLSAPFTTSPLTTAPSVPKSFHSRFSSGSSGPPIDAGEAPFLFSPEAEAAAAAQLREAGLQPSVPPNILRFPDLPPLDNTPSTLSRQNVLGQHVPSDWPSSTLPLPSTSPITRSSHSIPTLAHTFNQIQTNLPPMDPPSSSPTFSSSLTGWAG